MRENKLQKFLVTSKDVVKESYRWNSVSSIIFAFQSVFILMILTRTVGIEQSGIFTIAYASASLFLFVGKYGVRYYQVSDVKSDHTFRDYQVARIISVLAMIIISLVYVIIGAYSNGYSTEKSLIILLVCLLKVPDAMEDVYYGEYQKRGRLDIGAKALAIRLGLTLLVLLIVVVVTHNLLIALFLATILSYGLMWYCVHITSTCFKLESKLSWYSVKQILVACFPLFVGNFLSQYIGNASKYAIDANLGDELQACYGFISMPVFVIGLLSNVIFTPIIRIMAEHWEKNNKRAFLTRLIKQIRIVFGITIVCILGAALLGIPVLSIMYNTNLSPYKKELLILLLGGGFLALSGLLNTVLTIMRFQYPLLWGYAGVAVVALASAEQVVRKWGMTGAAWLYTLLMAALMLIFLLIMVVALIKDLKVRGKD